MWVDMKELKTTSQSSTSTVVPATSTTVCSTNLPFASTSVSRVHECTCGRVHMVSTTCGNKVTPLAIHTVPVQHLYFLLTAYMWWECGCQYE